uniref:Uncharacterized protein n=1 Tax=Saccharum spontaneum TaxID=62335 RepID=A0A678TGW9_SACSP|nr:hypothetical protein SS20H10_000002 [Saccharum spontaneum]
MRRQRRRPPLCAQLFHLDSRCATSAGALLFVPSSSTSIPDVPSAPATSSAPNPSKSDITVGRRAQVVEFMSAVKESR